MPDINLFQKAVQRFTSGFIFAFHDIPSERLEEFVILMRPAKPIQLSELVERSKQGKNTSGLFAITVDDGVGATVRNLSKLFLARQWPATFYLPTRYIDTAEGMAFQWWRWLVPRLPQRRLHLNSGTALDLSAPHAVEKLSADMETLWHTRRPEAYWPLTMDLVEIILRDRNITKADIHLPEPITWSEVSGLSRSDVVRFESHGVSHAAMSCLNDEELNFELRHSRDCIAEHTSRPCRHIAYPFGNALSIGPKAAAQARTVYDSATTMSPGQVDHANPWLLPRIPLYPENSPLKARLKVLLKCGPLRSFSSDQSAA